MALNRAALDELRALDPDGSAGLLAQIINSYLGDAPAQVSQIKAAVAVGDSAGLTRHAHSLKSTSLSLGATRVGELARALEMAGKNNALADCPALVESLATAYALADEGLRAEIAAATKSA